tara:strand:+ start:214 stop:561 length:348 start_codon:yes stop_codon:yes gene_type:complete
MSVKQVKWKWSNGETYEKSLRSSKVQKQDNETIQVCLNDETRYNEVNEIIDISKIPKGFIHKENKLNGQNEKLSNRHMIVQKGINPYVNTENYVTHLDTETSFLRPKDSNFSDKQ